MRAVLSHPVRAPPAATHAMILTPSTKPTMIFIGVTTGQSSINRIFPEWARTLELGDCTLRGLDFPLHDEPAHYREAVAFIKQDPMTRGALVTTHKIDLCAAAHDLSSCTVAPTRPLESPTP
jgi:shikimate 5-dehydrogenase